MPIAIVDTEQAALIEVALTMLEAALTARVTRADPDKIISHSLSLQAKKLATVRMMLAQPDPLSFSMLDKATRDRAEKAMAAILEHPANKTADALWEKLRALMVASPGPG